MTNIGAVYEAKKILEEGGEQKWLEMIIEMPFCERLRCAIYPNKNKKNPNDPTWLVWRSYNRKGENFRAVQIGAIWDKVSKSGNPYKAGHIESAAMNNGKLHFSLFASKVYEGEDPKRVTWAYDVMYSAPEKSYTNSNNSYDSNYNQPPEHYYTNVDFDYGNEETTIIQ